MPTSFDITIFKNLYDNTTDKQMSFDTWDSFSDFFKSLAKVEMEKKSDAVLISPAVYKEGTTRAIANVSHWSSWAAIDVDSMPVDYNLVKETLESRFKQNKYLVYSTASSTLDIPKFRVVFPLTRTVTPEEFPHFWYALNKTFGEVVDRQTKDLTRMFYVPGCYANSFNFFYAYDDADPIDPDVFMDAHEFVTSEGLSLFDRLPDEIKERIIDHKKNNANSKYTWTNYTDCPFVSKKLVKEYSEIAYRDGSGRYHKMYCIMISIAAKAIKSEYAITAEEIACLVNEIDTSFSSLYTKRPLIREAGNALEYAYRLNV
jgi:hypothetical protein